MNPTKLANIKKATGMVHYNGDGVEDTRWMWHVTGGRGYSLIKDYLPTPTAPSEVDGDED